MEIGSAAQGWFPVLTLILGYVAKAGADMLQDRRADVREREARIEARAEKTRLEHLEFQTKSLIELQDVASVVEWHINSFHSYDQALYKGGEWKTNMVAQDEFKLFREGLNRLMVLSSRIDDEPTRNFAGLFRKHVLENRIAPTKDAAEEASNKLQVAFVQLTEAAGLAAKSLRKEEKAITA